MNKNFAASVLNRIHKKKISPRERVYFIAKRVLQVVAGILFLGLGMVAIAILWFMLTHIEFVGMIMDSPRILLKWVMWGIPLLWALLAAASGVVAEKLIQSTGRLYRVSFGVLAGGVLLVQVIGGVALESLHVGEMADAAIERQAHWYQGNERINRRLERAPEHGFLVGAVKEIKSKELILVNDMSGEEWRVKLQKRADVRQELEVGMKIHMVGEMLGEQEFLAAHWRAAGDRPLFKARKGKRKGEHGEPSPLFDRLREGRRDRN